MIALGAPDWSKSVSDPRGVVLLELPEIDGEPDPITVLEEDRVDTEALGECEPRVEDKESLPRLGSID